MLFQMDTVTAQILLNPLSFHFHLSFSIISQPSRRCTAPLKGPEHIWHQLWDYYALMLNFLYCECVRRKEGVFSITTLVSGTLPNGTGHKAEQCGQDTIIQMSMTDRVQYTLTLSESKSGQYLTPRSCPLNRGRSESGSEEYVWVWGVC